jgi:hypothetical protein
MRKILKKFKIDPFELADDIVLEIASFITFFESYLSYIFKNKEILKKNKILHNSRNNEEILILGNSPALNDLNFELIKEKNIIVLNRIFEHKLYDKIKPKYHVIVDTKLSTGEWPISYIDIILKKNPGVNLFLNAKWYDNHLFSRFKKTKNIFWISTNLVSNFRNNFSYNITKPVSTYMALEVALSVALFLGSKNISFYGVEGNGIAYLMIGKKSHFSGKDKDYSSHTSLNYARSMLYNARWIRIWHKISNKLNSKKIKLFNLMSYGLLDMIPKKNLKSFFAEKNE